MKLFKHSHKWHLQNYLEKRIFSNGDEEEAVILICDCKNCDMAGKKIAHRISELQGAFTEGRDSIVRYLAQYNITKEITKKITYDNPDFWSRLCDVGYENQHGGTNLMDEKIPRWVLGKPLGKQMIPRGSKLNF